MHGHSMGIGVQGIEWVLECMGIQTRRIHIQILHFFLNHQFEGFLIHSRTLANGLLDFISDWLVNFYR